MSDISDARQCSEYKVLEARDPSTLTGHINKLLKEVVKDSYAVFRWVPYGPLQIVRVTDYDVRYTQAMILVYDRYLMPFELREELDKVTTPQPLTMTSFLDGKVGEVKSEKDPITSFILS